MSKLEAENILAAGLYIVSTPIGNLGDLSDRAKTILAGVDLVLCEDSRVSGKLLNFFTISNRLSPYHEHNAVQVRDGILEKLADGQRIALISDAGTPAIADPGFKLVRAARQAGICVFSVPGPSALIAALSISGLPTDRFFFQGFLPSRQPARRQLLQTLKEMPGTLVCYESPKRLVDTLEDAAEIIGDRAAAVARELTKNSRRDRFRQSHRNPSPILGAISSSWRNRFDDRAAR